MESGSALDGAAFVDCFDLLVDEGFVDQRPRRFGRLQFGRLGRQKSQADAVRNIQTRFAMPACVVENEHDGSIDARAFSDPIESDRGSRFLFLRVFGNPALRVLTRTGICFA
jgi:hypothetical protein